MPRRPDLNLRQIEAFNAVMEAGSVTGAAGLLNVSQPAVSRLIRDLEHQTGLALFERRRGRILATVEAQALHDVVQTAFTGLDKIANAAQDIRAFRSGSLQIAAMPAIALQCLPRVITAFSRGHPGINVSLQIRSSTKVGEWVSSQQADIGLAALHSVGPGTEQHTLCAGSLVAVLPDDHRLADGKTLDPTSLQGEPMILLGTELSMRQQIGEAFARHNADLFARIDVQLSAAVCEFVRAGAGIGLVDPITAVEMSDRGLRVARFEPAIPFTFTLLLPTNRTRPIFLQSFIDELVATLRANPFVTVPPEL